MLTFNRWCSSRGGLRGVDCCTTAPRVCRVREAGRLSLGRGSLQGCKVCSIGDTESLWAVPPARAG